MSALYLLAGHTHIGTIFRSQAPGWESALGGTAEGTCPSLAVNNVPLGAVVATEKRSYLTIRQR